MTETNTEERYPPETEGEDSRGSMEESRDALAEAVVGRRIVSIEPVEDGGWENPHVITLDDGSRVRMSGESDCCAYAELDGFLLDPGSVDHVITGVGTTDGFETWHVYADMGDVLKLDVSWSEGSGYYAYGFTIRVEGPADD